MLWKSLGKRTGKISIIILSRQCRFLHLCPKCYMSLLRLGKDNWARTSPTKEGLIFLALSLFVGFAAINTGNNLLYLTFGMMLSFVIASGIVSMINLSRINVELHSTGDVFALTPAKHRFMLTNDKAFIPSYSLTVEMAEKKGYLTYLPPNKPKPLDVEAFYNKRGINTVPEAILSTRFPFGFFKKWIKIDLGKDEVLVYPKLEEGRDTTSSYNEKLGDIESNRTGTGDNIRTLRQYVDGDNPKYIHWKATAKTGTHIIKEMEDNETQGVRIEFQPNENKSELEHQISRLAKTIVELIRNGYEVEFIAPDRVITPAETGHSPRPVLTYLALYDG